MIEILIVVAGTIISSVLLLLLFLKKCSELNSEEQRIYEKYLEDQEKCKR